jgi:hypothetical protein
LASDGREGAHHCSTDPLTLILIDDGESHFALPGPNRNVSRSLDDRRFVVLLGQGHQGHMINEVDGKENMPLPFP